MSPDLLLRERGAGPLQERPIDLDLYFRGQARREPPYGGQSHPAFQAALAKHHDGVEAEDCDFYHVVELDDGRRFGGEWDLRGREQACLGEQPLAGRTVIEFGPASGWLSQHIARRAAALTVFDLPFGAAPEIMPFPGIDADACRRSGAADIARLRNSWWFTRRKLGFSATAFYADIYDPPSDLGCFDVAVFGSLLLHLSDPFRALRRAAERTRETIVVTDVVGPQEDVRLPQPGLGPDLAALVFGPTLPPIGVVHWWALSSGAVTHMLHRLGFTEATVTRHRDLPLFTVVASRPR